MISSRIGLLRQKLVCPQALSKWDFQFLQDVIGSCDLIDLFPEGRFSIHEDKVGVVLGLFLRKSNSIDHWIKFRDYIIRPNQILQALVVSTTSHFRLERQRRTRDYEFKDIPPRLSVQANAKVSSSAFFEASVYNRHLALVEVSCRFQMPKMPRNVRRILLTILNDFEPSLLLKDFKQQAQRWKWVGEFLHPGEYGPRYVNAYAAFQAIRQKTKYIQSNSDVRSLNRFEINAESIHPLLPTRDPEGSADSYLRNLSHLLRTREQADEAIVAALTEILPKASEHGLLAAIDFFARLNELREERIFFANGRYGVRRHPDGRKFFDSEQPQVIFEMLFKELRRRKANLQESSAEPFRLEFKYPQLFESMMPGPPSPSRGASFAIADVLKIDFRWRQPPQRNRVTKIDLLVGLFDSDWRLLSISSSLLDPLNEGAISIVRAQKEYQQLGENNETLEINVKCCQNDMSAKFAVIFIEHTAGLPMELLQDLTFSWWNATDSSTPDQTYQHGPYTPNFRGQTGLFVPLIIDFSDQLMYWASCQMPLKLNFYNLDLKSETLSTSFARIFVNMKSLRLPSDMSRQLALALATYKGVSVISRAGSIEQLSRQGTESALDYVRRANDVIAKSCSLMSHV